MLALIALLLATSTLRANAEASSAVATTSQAGSQQDFGFSLVPSQGGGQGSGNADISVEGPYLTAHIHVEGVPPGARLMVVLEVNGTGRSIANMTASSDGEVESESAVALAQGTYMVGVSLVDTSTPGSPVTYMVSSPLSTVVTVQSAGATQTGEDAQTVNTYATGESEDGDISAAMQSGLIPAVVNVGGNGSSVHLNDNSFAVSVGTFQVDGYLVSLSSVNVSGPRVLMVSLAPSALGGMYLKALAVTIDGAPVQQAGSFTQVLGGSQQNVSRFIVVSGASGLRLLILIPHFSAHTIAILPVLSAILGAVAVDVPVLLLAVASVTLAVVIGYSRRVRVGPHPF